MMFFIILSITCLVPSSLGRKDETSRYYLIETESGNSSVKEKGSDYMEEDYGQYYDYGQYDDYQTDMLPLYDDYKPGDSQYDDYKPGELDYSDYSVGATYIDKNQYPWLVALIDAKKGYYFCCGSLLSKKFVLTAGHCMYKERKHLRTEKRRKENGFFVNVHEHDLRKKDGEVRHDVGKIYLHPSYRYSPLKKNNVYNINYDFALLELKSPVTKKGMKYICLPQPEKTYIATRAKTAGWGSDECKVVPPIAKHLTMVTITDGACRKAYPKLKMTNNRICAKGESQPKNQKSGCCNGDSGGPLMRGKIIIGVVSGGDKPCGKKPTIFARVTSQLEWIREHVKDACTGSETVETDIL